MLFIEMEYIFSSCYFNLSHRFSSSVVYVYLMEPGMGIEPMIAVLETAALATKLTRHLLSNIY